MTKQTTDLSVEGMSCQHCVRAVTNAVNALAGVSGVEVSLEQKKVTVGYDPGKVSLDLIKGAIEEQGYSVLK
jgi:copper chaperone